MASSYFNKSVEFFVSVLFLFFLYENTIFQTRIEKDASLATNYDRSKLFQWGVFFFLSFLAFFHCGRFIFLPWSLYLSLS